jgi:hypothetical protein
MTKDIKSEEEIVKDKFYSFLKVTSLEHGLKRDHIHIMQSYGRNCLLLGWSHQPYDEAIKKIHELYPKISEKAIGKVLAQSMVKLFNQQNVSEDADPEIDAPILTSIFNTLDVSAINTEVNYLIDSLKSKIKKWTSFVFLEGIELKNLDKLSLGISTLYPKNRGPLCDALEKLKAVNHLDIPESIEIITNHCLCYITTDIEGEDDFVAKQALNQAQNITNVLNLYVESTWEKGSFERIGVLGQPSITKTQLVLKQTPPVGEDDNPYYSYKENFPPTRRHEIDSRQENHWKENGLSKVIECITSQEFSPDSAISRIHNAIVWYGRAMNSYHEDEQFVDLIIALESLLVVEEGINITQRLGDGVAALLGTNLKHRDTISKRVKELYKLRCRLVHAGIPVSQENLFYLDKLASNTILAFVRKELA